MRLADRRSCHSEVGMVESVLSTKGALHSVQVPKTSHSPLDDDTISLEILDCLRERGESRAEASLLRNIHAKKSSFVAPAGCDSLPEGPCRFRSNSLLHLVVESTSALTNGPVSTRLRISLARSSCLISAMTCRTRVSGQERTAPRRDST